MANPAHVDVLKKGLEGWKQWKRENPSVEVDLSGVDLRRIDFEHGDLEGANLMGTNLRAARLSGANLRQANLRWTHLGWTDLRGADLSGAYLMETGFGNTYLYGAKGLDTCIHEGPSILDYRTLAQSGHLPPTFLRGCGLPDTIIEYLPSLLNEPLQFYSCFISYSHTDKAFALRLYDSLQSRGIRCWLDEKQLLPGDDIYEHIEQGIRLWDKVLLCCSEQSLMSWWVDNEIATAFEKEQQLMKDRGRRVLVLIPLNLDGYLFSRRWNNGKAAQVKQRVAADFTGWETSTGNFDCAVKDVIKALRADEGARAAAPLSRL